MFEQMYRASMFYGRKGLPVAVISVIDLAIWDLLGHIRNEPVYKMLGGATRERLNFYCTGPEPAAAKEMGFFGAKVPLPYGPGEGVEGLKKNVEFLTKHRESVGPDFPLMVDCYMSLNVPYTIEVVKATEHLNLNWWEECLSPDDSDGFEQIKRAHPRMKFTTGEHEYSRYGFRPTTFLLCPTPVDHTRTISLFLRPTRHSKSTSQTHRTASLFCPSSATCKFPLNHLPNVLLMRCRFTNEPIPTKGYLDVKTLDLPGFGLKLNPNAGLIDATRILNPAPQKALKPAEPEKAEVNGHA
jgi:hypothetical protein